MSADLAAKLEREFHKCWSAQADASGHAYNKDAFRDFQRTITEATAALKSFAVPEVDAIDLLRRIRGSLNDNYMQLSPMTHPGPPINIIKGIDEFLSAVSPQKETE